MIMDCKIFFFVNICLRLKPDVLRELVTMILMRFRISLRRALALISLSPSMYYYRRKRNDYPALELMRAYADENPAHDQAILGRRSNSYLNPIAGDPFRLES